MSSLPVPYRTISVPLFGPSVCAGFPSPADDYIEAEIQIARELVQHPAATFVWTVAGESMKDAGIFDGDLLVVDRALEPIHDDVVVAVVDGTLSVKRFLKRGDRARLTFENAEFPDFNVADAADVEIWGVVTWNLHPHRRARA